MTNSCSIEVFGSVTSSLLPSKLRTHAFFGKKKLIFFKNPQFSKKI